MSVAVSLLSWIVVGAPIINGTDDAQHPAVVALGTRGPTCDDVFSTSCTGTLIAPRVVLTAAHCVEQGSRRGSDALVGRSETDRDAVHRALEVFIHPQYDDATDANDIALVVLDRAAAVAPLALRDRPLDPSDAGRSVTIVGFGTPDGTAPAGTKRVGTAVVESVFANGFQIESAPAMTCHGDSGGPALVMESGVEVVIGVAVTGDLGCDAIGIHADAGSYYADFIAPVLDYAAGLPVGMPDDCVDQEGGCNASSSRSSILVALGFLCVLLKGWARRRAICSRSVQRA